jgi:2-methylisocitrate lyase-like PEP mutase family enzyme
MVEGGHVKGKSTVSREEAYSRVQAAVDARDAGGDIVMRL